MSVNFCECESVACSHNGKVCGQTRANDLAQCVVAGFKQVLCTPCRAQASEYCLEDDHEFTIERYI